MARALATRSPPRRPRRGTAPTASGAGRRRTTRPTSRGRCRARAAASAATIGAGGRAGDAEFAHVALHLVRGLGGGAAGRLELVAELLELAAAGHQPGQFLQGDLLLLVVADAAAAVEQQETVTHRVGVVRVVGDEDDPQAPFPGLDDVLQHHAGLL